jgi:major type 1 subunit fimbrin (pilin)
MNKTLLSAALVAVMAAAGFAPTAQAVPASGTITIKGAVLADTCTVDVNGGAAVVLPSVMTGALATAGTTTGDTSFAIGLSACDANAISATMVFNGSNIDSTTGYLNNTGSATNVKVQLVNAASAVINTSTNANAPLIALANGTGSTSLKARYVAVGGAATAGVVQTSVGFTLTYL